MPEISKKSWRDRGLDFLNNLWAGATLMVVTFVSATLYTHFGKEWARPIMNGLITGAGAMMTCPRKTQPGKTGVLS